MRGSYLLLLANIRSQVKRGANAVLNEAAEQPVEEMTPDRIDSFKKTSCRGFNVAPRSLALLARYSSTPTYDSILPRSSMEVPTLASTVLYISREAAHSVSASGRGHTLESADREKETDGGRNTETHASARGARRRPTARALGASPSRWGRERARRGDDTGSPHHTEIVPVQCLRLPVRVGLRSDGYSLSNGAAPPRGPALAKEGASVREWCTM